MTLTILAIIGAVWGSDITQLLGLKINAHGHTHVYAHGHSFVDARTLWGIPNAIDVLSNLTFLVLGSWGLWTLRRVPNLQGATRQSLGLFFIGLILTCLASSYYHLAPSVWGLAIDRAGMTVAFAGVLALACAEHVSQRAARWMWPALLTAGFFAIGIQYELGAIAPWVVVQFGGIAVVLWASTMPRQTGAIGLRWSALIGMYAVAKVLEMGDDAVFHASQGLVSGHSLKHIAASLAALPVIFALRHNVKQQAALAV